MPVPESAGASAGNFPPGTVFFPPARLVKRTLETGDSLMRDAGRWVHPDLEGPEGTAFSTGAMLYRVFCGAPPFLADNSDELRQDIRESVYLPPHLAAPGIAPEIAAAIANSMSSVAQNREQHIRPSPDFIAGLTGPVYSRKVSSWFRPLGEEESAKIGAEREQYTRKKNLAVKTRRFVIRNTAIIAASFIALLVTALFIRNMIRHRAELPTTRGMTPVEVAEAYYGAFENLDHTLMEACVTNKAGKNDIDMVVNLYVMTKMRQAYETTGESYITAQKWLEQGRLVTDKTVFGVTGLRIRPLSENSESAVLDAEYILWMPSAYLREEEPALPAKPGGENAEEPAIIPPGGIANTDRLTLAFRNGMWRITGLERASGRF
jgi:hypothetical protein